MFDIEKLENEIQSWVAVQSEHSCQLASDAFVVCANDLAEFIKDLFGKEKAKLEGCVVVPINNATIVAVEKMVEQQVEASGITADVFRLDGEKILNAAVEAARGGK